MGFMVMIAALFAACGDDADSSAADDEAEQDLIPVRLQLAASSMSFLDALAAYDLGLFEDAGLEVDLLEPLNSSSQTALSVSSGAADVALTTGTATVAVIAEDRPLSIFAAGATRPGTVLVLSNAAVDRIEAERAVTPESPLTDRVAALEGLRLAVGTAGGGSEVATRALLEAHGVSVDNAILVTSSTGNVANMIAALQADQVDGMVFSVPPGLQPVQEGFGSLWVSGPDGEYPSAGYFTTWSVHDGFLSEHPEVADRFVAALEEFHQILQSDPEEVGSAVRDRFVDLDEDFFELSLETVASAFVGPALSSEALAETVAVYNESADTPISGDTRVALEDFVTE